MNHTQTDKYYLNYSFFNLHVLNNLEGQLFNHQVNCSINFIWCDKSTYVKSLMEIKLP